MASDDEAVVIAATDPGWPVALGRLVIVRAALMSRERTRCGYCGSVDLLIREGGVECDTCGSTLLFLATVPDDGMSVATLDPEAAAERWPQLELVGTAVSVSGDSSGLPMYHLVTVHRDALDVVGA